MIRSFSLKSHQIFKADFLESALISQWLELWMPDWSQIKYNLKMFTSEANLALVIKPFENLRRNIKKQC